MPMYCSECFFFRNDGICKNPQSKFKDVGYFQKAGKCFKDPVSGEAELAEVKYDEPTTEIEETMSKDVIHLPEKVEELSKKRVCAECGRELPIDSFQRSSKGEPISICKECMAKRRKAGRAKGEKSPEQKIIDAVDARLLKGAELCKSLTDAELAAELRRRGYTGKLTKIEELDV